jgi:4-amino-4-deoxy-L-arabinose transferase-like glycosyltransferase
MNYLKENNHLFNCFIFTACTGLLGLLAYYKLDKLWGKLLLLFMVLFNIITALIMLANSYNPLGSLIGGVLVATFVGFFGMLAGGLIGEPKWFNSGGLKII